MVPNGCYAPPRWMLQIGDALFTPKYFECPDKVLHKCKLLLLPYQS